MCDRVRCDALALFVSFRFVSPYISFRRISFRAQVENNSHSCAYPSSLARRRSIHILLSLSLLLLYTVEVGIVNVGSEGRTEVDGRLREFTRNLGTLEEGY